MLVRHYSMHGDTIHVHGWPTFDSAGLGRTTRHHVLQLESRSHAFWNGPFFRRYVCNSATSAAPLRNLGDEDFQVLLGDSAAVLRSLPAATFDGAVTSPPLQRPGLRAVAQHVLPPARHAQHQRRGVQDAEARRALPLQRVRLLSITRTRSCSRRWASGALRLHRRSVPPHRVRPDRKRRLGQRRHRGKTGLQPEGTSRVPTRPRSTAGSMSSFQEARSQRVEEQQQQQAQRSMTTPDPNRPRPSAAAGDEDGSWRNVHGHHRPFPTSFRNCWCRA